MCDASAAIGLDHDYFAAASDEDNILRFYRLSQPGAPIHSTNLAQVLGLKKKAELDLEGAARLGPVTFLITSHGRNAAGEPAPQRHQLFALTIAGREGNYQVTQVGRSYTNLLADLAREPDFARFGFASATGRAPKEVGGLNIEGLTDTPDGRLLIGFRNPIPDGKALLIPLLNPKGVVAGEPAAFGTAILLDLGGLGVRGLGSLPDGSYYIVAGPKGGGGQSRLYFWPDEAATPEVVPQLLPAGANPEGICFHDSQRSQFLILTDDGSRRMGGVDCKKLPEASRQFRAYLLDR
jgi:hypothetical protein